MSDKEKEYINSEDKINQDKSENHSMDERHDYSITSNLGEVPEKIPDFTPGDDSSADNE